MKERIIEIIKDPKIFRKGGFVLRANANSNFYVNIKKAYGTPGFLSDVAQKIHKIIDKEVTCVVGMGVGGMPMASVYGELYKIPICLIRDKPKAHGVETQIESYLPTKKDKVVILDDVYTTGSSIRDAAKALQSTGAKIIQACVILARVEPKLNFPTKSVLTLKDIS